MRSSAFRAKVSGWAAGVGIALLAGASAPAVAGPLDKARVDGEARWVVHVNVEAAVASMFGQSMHEAYHTFIDVVQDGRCAEVLMAAGVDLLRDVKGATFYGFEMTSGEGVVVLDSTAAVQRLFTHLEEEMPGFARVSEQPHAVYTWPEREKTRFASVRREGGEGRYTVILAPDRLSFDRAAAVLDGKASSLAVAKEPPLSQEPRIGSVLFVAAEGMNMAGGGRQAAMLSRLTSAMAIDMGEAKNEVFAEVTLTSRSDREADAMVQIIHGMLAMAQLKVHDEPELLPMAPMLAAVRVEKDGWRIVASGTADSSLVREALSGLLAMDVLCDDLSGAAAPSNEEGREERANEGDR